jgi:hypothetical protein
MAVQRGASGRNSVRMLHLRKENVYFVAEILETWRHLGKLKVEPYPRPPAPEEAHRSSHTS